MFKKNPKNNHERKECGRENRKGGGDSNVGEEIGRWEIRYEGEGEVWKVGKEIVGWGSTI